MIDLILFVFAALLLTHTITDICFHCLWRKGYAQLFSSIAVCVMLLIFMDTEPHIFMYVVAAFLTSEISSTFYTVLCENYIRKESIKNELKSARSTVEHD